MSKNNYKAGSSEIQRLFMVRIGEIVLDSGWQGSEDLRMRIVVTAGPKTEARRVWIRDMILGDVEIDAKGAGYD